MKRIEIAWGGLLIGAGVLLLLENFGLLGPADNLIWTLLFALGSGIFFAVFLNNRAQWWALIPGFALLSITALSGIDQFFPAFAASWGGALVLGGIGVSFWTIYALRREHWWAIIPGGVLFTLALITVLSTILPGEDTGGVFFLGLAATFGLVALVPTPHGQMKWALIPATVLGVMGVAILSSTLELLNLIWPLALIVVGLYLVYRTINPQPEPPALTTRKDERYDEPTLPQPR